MNSLTFCGSAWNWSVAYHPQFRNWSCVLHQPLHALLTLVSRGNCWSEIINIHICRPKYSICFLNWLLHGDSGQIISAVCEPHGRELWQWKYLHSPCCPLEKSGSFCSSQSWCSTEGPSPYCHTGSLLWQLNFSSKTALPYELYPGNVAWLYSGRSLQSPGRWITSLGLAFHGLVLAIVCLDQHTTESWRNLLVTGRKVLMTLL